MTNPIAVAVDGPSASGKSTVSKQVARALGYLYVDSGALYRGVTWKALRERVDVEDSKRVIEVMREADWNFVVRDGALIFEIDGEDPGLQLRSEPVRERVSVVATIPEVRDFIVDRLRESTRYGSVVMEGRDIGSVVFPDTPWKFYLDADPEERARRRHQEQLEMEEDGDVREVMESLEKRDRIDSTRKTAPLQIPLGAEVINSTLMSIPEVVGTIASRVKNGLADE